MKTPLFCQVSKCGGILSFTWSFVEHIWSITSPWGFVCSKAISMGFVDEASLVFSCLYVDIESKQYKFLCVCTFSLNTSCGVLWPLRFLRIHFSEDDLSVLSYSAFCHVFVSVLSPSLNAGPILTTGVTWAGNVQLWIYRRQFCQSLPLAMCRNVQ